MNGFRFHPSSVGNLMGAPKSLDLAVIDADPSLSDADKSDLKALCKKLRKTEDEQALLVPYWERTLSEGAKTYVKNIAREFLFGYRQRIDTKYMEKGRMCEQDSIDLYNAVHFTRHVKNTQRVQNDWLTGEWDIEDQDEETIDIKTCWSLDTFPMMAEDAHNSLYEWQGVGYGILRPRVKRHKVAFCMVDTPDEILDRFKWEDRDAHKVSHIDPSLRVTTITYERDPDKERRLEVKCRAAQQYLDAIVARIRHEKGIAA